VGVNTKINAVFFRDADDLIIRGLYNNSNEREREKAIEG
jgi:hypothetical protein